MTDTANPIVQKPRLHGPLLCLGFLVLLSALASSCDDQGGDPDGCPSGTIPGECGLAGHCVQCNSDEDCKTDGKNGVCTNGGHCILPELQCEVDSQCLSDRGGLKCIRWHCVTPCTYAGDCAYGSVCGPEAFCTSEHCQQGACPADWVPIDGTLLCSHDGCSALGLRRGACGLAEQCVECFADAHCPGGLCSDTGACVPVECVDDATCQAGVCVKGRCVQACVAEADCGPNERCAQSASGLNGCVAVRCTEYGACEDWRYTPVPSSLRCEYHPCADPEYMVGVCGLSESCVHCLDDTDCDVGRRCTPAGKCTPFPECPIPEGYSNCGNGQLCFENICRNECESDVDCRPFPRPDGSMAGTGQCLPPGYCFYERCDRSGGCPEGWLPAQASFDGTMECRLSP